MSIPAPLVPPRRILMGPGPSDVPDSILRAMAAPTVGHLDPYFLQVMDEVRDMLRATFGTENALTIPISGTGSAGMEACMVNVLEPGDRVLVGVNGVFGGRMAEVARRCGATVDLVEGEWGRALTPDQFRKTAAGRAYKLLAVVHAETSTGVSQDLSGLRAVADEVGALFMIDAVTSLGGSPVNLDQHGVDLAYSGTQKCLSCPPGLAPISLSERAMAALANRKTPVQSWYLDLSLVQHYWGAARAYHHTAPVNMVYALHESLRLALTEGLDARYARHARLGAMLQSGLEEMGFALLVPKEERLAQLTAVRVPDGVSDAGVRTDLMDRYGLEIGGGLGPFKGKLWRIGLMGAACTERNVALLLNGVGVRT
jgi:alanine-glyoxylate transaminase / serine-glyoxylate transaminase / serine-pyruvate transaminase